MCVCVWHACVRVCVRACVRVHVHVCGWVICACNGTRLVIPSKREAEVLVEYLAVDAFGCCLSIFLFTLLRDQRGRHEPGNKTKPETVDSVKAHINSFPKYTSHYLRKDNPHRQFLNPYLSIHKMYQLYKEKCEEENTQAASEWIYRKTFNENFNLSFGRYD